MSGTRTRIVSMVLGETRLSSWLTLFPFPLRYQAGRPSSPSSARGGYPRVRWEDIGCEFALTSRVYGKGWRSLTIFFLSSLRPQLQQLLSLAEKDQYESEKQIVFVSSLLLFLLFVFIADFSSLSRLRSPSLAPSKKRSPTFASPTTSSTPALPLPPTHLPQPQPIRRPPPSSKNNAVLSKPKPKPSPPSKPRSSSSRSRSRSSTSASPTQTSRGRPSGRFRASF